MVHLEDLPVKHRKLGNAELSRPNRAASENACQERQKTEKRGRPRVHNPRNAVYHNWFSPFLWNQILLAGKAAGTQMSATAIRDWLRRRDPATFGDISRSTIYDWIDRSGTRPQWSKEALDMAEKGNHQCHPNGGRRGALIRQLTEH